MSNEMYAITYEMDGSGGFIPIFKMRGERLERVCHRDGSPVRCKSIELAELAAAKHLLARLNKSAQPQEHFVARNSVRIHHPQRDAPAKAPPSRAPIQREVDRIFANFPKEKK